MRTMATKTYTIKAKDVGAATKAASATSSYYSKATTGAATTTRATAVKTTTARSYNKKSDFSTNPASSSSVASSGGSNSFSASPVSAAPAASSPSYSPYGDDSDPVRATMGSSRVGGDNGQSSESSMPFPNGAAGLKDAVIGERSLEEGEDWTRSFSGMAVEPFEKGVAEILMKPLDADDIEIKPGKIFFSFACMSAVSLPLVGGIDEVNGN